MILTHTGPYAKLQDPQSTYVMIVSALATMTCLFSSSLYHLYYVLNFRTYDFLLKLDLMGTGIMIYGLTLACVFVFFHGWLECRNYTMVIMGSLAFGNIII